MNRSKFYFLFSIFAATLIIGVLMFGFGTARADTPDINSCSWLDSLSASSGSSSCSGSTPTNTINWTSVSGHFYDVTKYVSGVERLVCTGTAAGVNATCQDSTATAGAQETYYIYAAWGGSSSCGPSGQVTINTVSSCNPLTVSCSPKNLTLNVGDTRTFTGSPSGGVAPYTYQWSNVTCGAGTTNTSQQCTLYFGAAGPYNPTITVGDSGGASKADSCPVTVNAPTNGSILIKRVDQNLNPISTIANVDALVSSPCAQGTVCSNNPSDFTSVTTGNHGANATDLSGFTETVGICTGASCTPSSFSPPNGGCNGSNCNQGISVTAGQVTNVVFKYTASTNGSVLIKRVDANLNPIPSSLISASTRGNVDKSVGASCADSNDFVCNNNPSLFDGYVGSGTHGITATKLSGFTQSVATCEYAIGQPECKLDSPSDYTSSCFVNGNDCWFNTTVNAGKVRKVVYRYADTPTCTINGSTNGSTSVKVGDHFVIPWSNSSNLKTLTSSGWSGPITCVGDESLCNAMHSGGGLPACPPQSTADCSWGGHNGSYLLFRESGTSNVTITATNGVGEQATCSHSVTATAVPSKKYSCSSSFSCVESASGTDLATCQSTCKPSECTLVIAPSSASVQKGSTAQFSALYDPDGPGGSQPEQNVNASANWWSDNTTIATSQGSGRFLGVNVSPPSAGIHATYSGCSGKQADATLTVTSAPNNPPVINSCDINPKNGNAPLPTNYTSSVTDPDGDPISIYRWNFGLGNMDLGPSGSFTYNSSGNYTVTLLAQDSHGAWSSQHSCGTVTVGAANQLPTGVHDTNDNASCTAQGWTADPDDRNIDLTVKIYSDGSLVKTDTANRFRSDLQSAGVCPGGTCAFVTSLAGAISTGVSHNIEVRAVDAQTGQEQPLGGTPKSILCPQINQVGTVVVQARDKNNQPINNIAFTLGSPSGTQALQITTNGEYDIPNTPTGSYRVWNVSGSYPSGQTFDRVDPCGTADCSQNLSPSGTLTFTIRLKESINQLPTGVHDANNNDLCRAEGWTADPDDRNIDLTVKIYSDGSLVKTDTANRFRSDLQSAGVCPGGTCAFVTSLAGAISTGVSHNIEVRAVDAQTGQEQPLGGTPKNISCTASPQNCDTSFPNDTFHACYFDGTNPPTGASPVLAQNNESTIDHDWGTGVVDGTSKSDQVSAIWRGRINFPAGNYVFHALSDDGVVLNLEGFGDIISNWTDHAGQDNSSQIALPTGQRNITLKWYENGGGAAIKLWWDSTTTGVLSCSGPVATCDGAWREIPGGGRAISQPIGIFIPSGKNTQFANSVGVVVRGEGQGVFHQNYCAASNNWQGSWTFLNGHTSQAPFTFVGAAWDILVKGLDGDKYHNINWSTGWTGWQNKGSGEEAWGQPTSTVVNGVPWEFRKESDGRISYKCGTTGGGGGCPSAPASITPADGQIVKVASDPAFITLSWAATSDTAFYNIRLDDGTNERYHNSAWTSQVCNGSTSASPHYVCENGIYATSLVGVQVHPGKTYTFWVDPVATSSSCPYVNKGGSFSVVLDTGGGGGGGGCTDECSSGASQCTDATHVQTCGNFDADSCLEWGPTPPNSCKPDEQCISGSCAALPPNPPTSFTASAGPACNVVNFFWTDTNSPPADSFTISCNGGAVMISGLTGDLYTFEGAEGNTTYNCAITAKRGVLYSTSRPADTGAITTIKCPDFGLNYIGELTVILSTAGTPKNTNAVTIEVNNAGTSFSGPVELSFTGLSGQVSGFAATPHFGAGGASTITLAPGQTTTFLLTVSGQKPRGTYTGFANVKGFAPSLGIEHTIAVPLKVEVKFPGFKEI